MRWSWLLVASMCVACEKAPEPEATSEPPTPAADEVAEPAGPSKPAPPTPREPEAVEEVQTARWVYPSSEMFSEGVIVSLEGGKRLDAVRELMKDERLGARIEVHTNPRGSGAYNLKMSKSRAESLLGVLSEEDAMFAARIDAVGLGEEVAPPEGVGASRVVIELFDASESDE